MATTSMSTAVAGAEPVFTKPERLALAGLLAGYTGLRREAYPLHLRQYASWCRHTRLFRARRAHMEGLARDREARGRPGRLSPGGCAPIAGFGKYAMEQELLEHSPAAHFRRPRPGTSY